MDGLFFFSVIKFGLASLMTFAQEKDYTTLGIFMTTYIHTHIHPTGTIEKAF